jgi:hypothetical protein
MFFARMISDSLSPGGEVVHCWDDGWLIVRRTGDSLLGCVLARCQEKRRFIARMRGGSFPGEE